MPIFFDLKCRKKGKLPLKNDGFVLKMAIHFAIRGIVGASVPIHKWKALNAFKTRETMLAGAGQGEFYVETKILQ